MVIRCQLSVFMRLLDLASWEISFTSSVCWTTKSLKIFQRPAFLFCFKSGESNKTADPVTKISSDVLRPLTYSVWKGKEGHVAHPSPPIDLIRRKLLFRPILSHPPLSVLKTVDNVSLLFYRREMRPRPCCSTMQQCQLSVPI